MRIFVITFNSLGAAGTPGTFYIINEFLKKEDCELYLCCEESEYTSTTRSILDNVKWICDPEELRNKKTWMFLSNQEIDIVFFIGMSGWNNPDLQIIPKIKTHLPRTKIAIDIKSPLLASKKSYQIGNI